MKMERMLDVDTQMLKTKGFCMGFVLWEILIYGILLFSIHKNSQTIFLTYEQYFQVIPFEVQ